MGIETVVNPFVLDRLLWIRSCIDIGLEVTTERESKSALVTIAFFFRNFSGIFWLP